MIDLDDFIMVVRFLVRCAYDPYYEHHVDNELNNSPHLQKLVSTVKLFHSERLNALAKLRRTCPRNYFLDELFEIKRVRSFQSVPEGAVCAFSGQPIRAGLTLVLLNKTTLKETVRCIGAHHQKDVYHFYELCHFHSIILSKLRRPIPAFVDPRKWSEECCNDTGKIKLLFLKYRTHIQHLESKS